MFLISLLKDKIRDLISEEVTKNALSVRYDNRRLLMEHNILHSEDSGVTDNRYCDHEIIVSLTTYGKRLYDVAVTIESVMEQTMKANRIILWLEDGLRNVEVPANLQKLQKRGLEIRYCEDIRSYKKLIPTLKEHPNDAIITIDDDMIYHYDMLEPLIVSHISHPDIIFCHRMHKIRLNEQGNLRPYNEWEYLSKDDSQSSFVFLTSGGGTIFPPHCFDEEVLNEEVFMDICKYADDVWWNAMALKSGTERKCIPYSPSDCFLPNLEAHKEGLVNVNVLEKMNDVQLKAVFEKYNLVDLLR